MGKNILKLTYPASYMLIGDFNIKTFNKHANKLKKIIKKMSINNIIFLGDIVK